ncbi:hypothetical protein B1729_12850 [Microbacterium sp. B35-04]|uniref:hypothetical protein n=1 Tax=Microbacterium sp. B35-04 TaxID=1961716 RepID=UPI0013D85B80|nr:hypothetical protein [Microbacterium sp. B35-04]KAF2412865.1 hypothetical protein B1729_12850 [Microbacterium sp. B35-04]
MTDVATKPRPGTSLRGFSAPILLVASLVVVPVMLGLLTTSWSTPDDEAYVRMAFASVAGATLAIAAVLGLLVDRIIRRATVATIAIFAVISLVVVPYELGVMSRAADLLLVRLSL